MNDSLKQNDEMRKRWIAVFREMYIGSGCVRGNEFEAGGGISLKVELF